VAALLAAAVVGWLAQAADHRASWAVVALGTVATVTLVVGLAAGRHEPLPAALALLGTAYAALLVLDDPPLDGRAAVLGAALLTIGELSYSSVELRSASRRDRDVVGRRVGWIALTALGALGLGGGILALADALHTGGVAVEALGVAAALGAVGLLVAAVAATRSAS
jgi:hypothetical protein